MSDFSLLLLEPDKQQRIAHVTAFIAEDASGSFGVLPGHHRLITVLEPGLARYKTSGPNWHWIALSSASLYFKDAQMSLSGQRFLLSDDYASLESALEQTLATEQENSQSMTRHIKRVEEAMMRRLARLDGWQAADE